jgi:uracil-DNA glycosylase family 4
VVKFLPLDENNKIRKPTHQEMNAGGNKLAQEIKDANPKSILALGKTAENFLKELYPNTQTYPYHNIGYVRTFIRDTEIINAWHPSYVLRRHGGLSVEWLEQMKPWAEAVKNV